MALSNYQGPPGGIGVLKHLKDETIKKTFVDQQGHIWLVMASGHALVLSAWDDQAEVPFTIEDPYIATQAEETRRRELQERIQRVRDMAPGCDL